MKIVAMLLALVLAAGGLMWAGHHRGYDDGVAATQKAAQKKVDKATGDRDMAIAERDAAQQSLANVQRTLDAQKRRLEIANFYANAAIAERAGLQKKLDAANVARATATRKAAHESPACADLARLPVCPVVSDRLWPQTADDPAHARH